MQNLMNLNFNRGFGGPPQPQRPGMRRGNRGGGGGGGGFRSNSRFDNNQPRNQNQGEENQGGQRPANEVPAAENPKAIQNQSPKIDKAAQNQPAAQQQKTQQTPPKPMDTVEIIDLEKDSAPAPPQAVNGNVGGGNKQGNWGQQGGPGNKQGGPQNQGGQGNRNQGQGQGNRQGGPQGQQGGPQGQQGGPQGQQGGPQGQHGGPQGQHGGPGNRRSGQGGPEGQQGPGQGNRQSGPQGQQGPANRQGGPGQGQGGPQGQGGFGGGPGGNRQGNRPFGQRGPGGPGSQGGGGGQQGPPRNQGRWQQDGKQGLREDHMLANKLKDLVGPLIDLAPLDQSEMKFNGRSRLYIGNLSNDVTEEEIMKMFEPFGEAAELFLNKEKGFGFIKMDFRVNAEKAKHELDGKLRNGRTLRVRFAPHNSAIRVKNLPPFVSNELLHRAFEIFGKIERAYVKVDERGKPLNEGVVEYARKPSALAAIRNCTEKCFFLTSSLRPVIVESYEEPDEADGYPEKNLPKKHPEFLKSRDVGPRFSEAGSFEHEYGTRWKQLHELHRQKEEALKKELQVEEEKLEAQMEYAKYEHETELLREQLRQREQDRERQKRSWELAERAADERLEQERTQQLTRGEELALRMRKQDDELRRRQQENTLFVQAQRLNSMLDRQEQGMFDQQPPMDGGYRDQFDAPRSYGDMETGQGRGWEGPRQIDDFPNKRRRF